MNKKKKYRKLPNKFGSITKLSGKREKQYMARITTGLNDDGTQIRSIIGYGKDWQECYQMLLDYSKKPYNIDLSKITFEIAFYQWLNWRKAQKKPFSQSSIASYNAVFDNQCKPLHKMLLTNIKGFNIQEIINNNMHLSYTKRNYIKILISQVFEWGAMNEIPIDLNITKNIYLGEKTESELHKPFSKEQKESLWYFFTTNAFNCQNELFLIVICTIIMCYSGLRPTELFTIKKENVFLEERYMVGGIKTKAGKNRIIPLHDKIIPIIRDLLLNNKNYLIEYNDMPIMYDWFKNRWNKLNEYFEWNNKPYDARHTFATDMDEVGANKLCLKKILGHSNNDITDSVYIHKNLETLIYEINKI